MSGLGYDVVVPKVRKRVVPQLETQARATVAAVRSDRLPRFKIMPRTRLHDRGPLK